MDSTTTITITCTNKTREPLFTKQNYPADAQAITLTAFGSITTQFLVADLKKEPAYINASQPCPFPVAVIGIKERILYVDANLVGGVRVRDNHVINLPITWDFNVSDSAVEIINESGVPVYQFQFIRPLVVELNGVVVFSRGSMFITVGRDGSSNEKLDKPIMSVLERLKKKDRPGFSALLPIEPRKTCIFKYPSSRFRGVYAD